MIKKQGIFLTFLGIFFLIISSPYASSYVLYTVEDSLPTEFHANPDALTRISNQPSKSILILMQDMLDRTRPITLNIDLNNFENAEELLEDMRRDGGRFNNFIIHLNINESTDIKMFKNLNQENIVSLSHLFRDVYIFMNLTEKESRYLEENNITMLFQIAQESEILKNNIKANFDEYYLRQDLMIETNNHFNLNSTKYLQSIEIFETIENEIIIIQEERMKRIKEIKQYAHLIDLNEVDNVGHGQPHQKDLIDEMQLAFPIPLLMPAASPMPLFITIILFLIFISISIYHLKNKKRSKTEIRSYTDLIFDESIDESTMEIITNSKKSKEELNEKNLKNPVYEEIKTNYHLLLGQNNFKQASNSLYKYLKELVVLKYDIKNHLSLTPREFAILAKKLVNNLNGSQMDDFIRSYEEIYYGNIVPPASNNDLLFNYWVSIIEDINVFNN